MDLLHAYKFTTRDYSSKSLLHTDRCSQSHCSVTASNDGRSSASGLTTSQACNHLTPTFNCWLQLVLPSGVSSRAMLTDCRLKNVLLCPSPPSQGPAPPACRPTVSELRTSELSHLTGSQLNTTQPDWLKVGWTVASARQQSFLVSGLVETYYPDLFSLLDMFVFENGAASSTRGRVGLCGTVVLARGYPRCHSVHVPMGNVHPWSLHYSK
jgi:hypothetical protein